MLLEEFHDGSGVFGRCQHHHPQHRLADLDTLGRLGKVVRPAHLTNLTVGELHPEGDRGSRGDERESVLALEAFPHDLHVKQAEEPAPETKPEGSRGLRLVRQRGIVQAEPLEGFAQSVELVTIGRKKTGKHHRLGFLVAGKHLLCRAITPGDGVTHLDPFDLLHSCDQVADLPGAQRRHGNGFGSEHTHLVGGEVLALWP